MKFQVVIIKSTSQKWHPKNDSSKLHLVAFVVGVLLDKYTSLVRVVQVIADLANLLMYRQYAFKSRLLTRLFCWLIVLELSCR